MCIYMYINIGIYVYNMCIYIYIYIERERYSPVAVHLRGSADVERCAHLPQAILGYYEFCEFLRDVECFAMLCLLRVCPMWSVLRITFASGLPPPGGSAEAPRLHSGPDGAWTTRLSTCMKVSMAKLVVCLCYV